jgi:alpha-N-arabinofuranosidase
MILAARGYAEQTPADTICQVDAKRLIRDIPRTLYGTNIEWFRNGNGLIDDHGVLRSDLVDAARDEGVSLLRFPGGTFSDYYRWEDGTGPRANRPTTKHFTDSGASKNVMGSPEIARLARATGSGLLITVNAGTATAQEAARWVAYFNAPGDARRRGDGFAAPFHVHYWEVGNELYLPGNPGVIKVAVSPEVYAARFKEYARAMKAVDPAIALIAIANANASRVTLPYPEWLETLLKAAAPEIDYIAVHNAYFPVLFEKKKPEARDVYRALWAAPEAIDRDLSRLEKIIRAYQAGKDIGIAVTEWGLLYSVNLDPGWIDKVKTMGSAVYVGRVLQVFVSHPKVRIANYFKFTDDTPIGWVAFDGKPKAPYYALQLFSRHFGARLVKSEIMGGKTYGTPPLGIMTEEKDVPEVTAAAALNDKGDRLFVNLINRSWSETHYVGLSVKGFVGAEGETDAWLLAAPAATDHNGPDLSPELSRRVEETPLSAELAGRPVVLRKIRLDAGKPIRLAPFSLLTVEIPAKN